MGRALQPDSMPGTTALGASIVQRSRLFDALMEGRVH